MLIVEEVSGDIDELLSLFESSPEKTELATVRALKKLNRWTERQVLRGMANSLNITQKLMKEFNRVHIRLEKVYGKREKYLSVWIGTNRVGAHRFGKARQTPRGVKVGSRAFYEGAFLMAPISSPRQFVFKRKDNWEHRFQRSKRSGRLMWMGLPLEKQTVSIEWAAEKVLRDLKPEILERFTDLLQTELNYAFNIES